MWPGRHQRFEMYAFSNENVLVWTGPKPITLLTFLLPSPSSLLKLPDLLTNAYINSGSKGGSMVRAVVRAHTSHQCGPGLNPGVDSVCWLI